MADESDRDEQQLTEDERIVLHRTARESIEFGVATACAARVDAAAHRGRLARPGASFVTIFLRDQLAGCMGTIEPNRPLIVDVSENAFAAAFRDPRFAPVTRPMLVDLRVHISVLGPRTLISAPGGEDEVIVQIRPGVDGIVLDDTHGHRATFLPSVWKQLPDPHEFLAHLKVKAGLPRDGWPRDLRVTRYEVEDIE